MKKYTCDKSVNSFSEKENSDNQVFCEKPNELKKMIQSKNKTVNNITINIEPKMDISTMNKLELLEKCKELGITKCNSKNKSQLIKLINNKLVLSNSPEDTSSSYNLQPIIHSKMNKSELLNLCKELGITKCNSKNKSQLIKLINEKNNIEENNVIISNNILSKCVNEDEKLNVIDLFCGCGGMSKGLTDAGLNIIAGIDIWDKAVESYNKNHAHKAYCEDLTNLPPEKFNELYNKDK